MPQDKIEKAEIFAVGKWNGMEFSDADLDGIVAAFASLDGNLKVPLKLGHNDEQPMTDGHPALGWVSKVWKDGKKLMAEFVDMPSVVMDAIKNKLYRKVSVELDIDVNHKGKHYDYVLSGVALLGADIPAVSTLADLTAYLSRGGFTASRKACFSAVAGNLKEIDMDEITKLAEQVKDLSAKLATMTDEHVALKRERDEMTSKLEVFEREAAEKAAIEAKAKIEAKRAEVTEALESAVKAGSITPAQRGVFAKMLKVEDDEAVIAIELDDVKALTGAKVEFSKDSAKAKVEEDPRDVMQKVTDQAHEIVASGEAKTFGAALQMLFSRDKELARDYLYANEEA